MVWINNSWKFNSPSKHLITWRCQSMQSQVRCQLIRGEVLSLCSLLLELLWWIVCLPSHFRLNPFADGCTVAKSDLHQPFPHPASLCLIFHGLNLYIPKCVPSTPSCYILSTGNPWSQVMKTAMDLGQIKPRSLMGGHHWCESFPRPWPPSWHGCTSLPSPSSMVRNRHFWEQWATATIGADHFQHQGFSQLTHGFKGSCHHCICCYNHLISLQKILFGPNPIHTSHTSQNTFSNYPPQSQQGWKIALHPALLTLLSLVRAQLSRAALSFSFPPCCTV